MDTNVRQFIRDLQAFQQKRLRLLWLSAGIRWMFILLIIWLSSALADHLFHFSEWSRWGLLLMNAGLLIWFAFLLFRTPLQAWRQARTDDLTDSAKELASFYPASKDDFVVAYQLSTKEQPAASDALRRAAVLQKLEPYRNEDFRSQLLISQFLPPLKWLLLLAVGILIVFAWRFPDIWHSTKRLVNPSNAYVTAPNFYFDVIPGNGRIISGNPLLIKVKYSGPALESCELHTLGQKTSLVRPLIKTDSAYVIQLKNIRQTLTYRIEGIPLMDEALNGILHSPVFTVRVLEPPRVETLDVRVQPPAYTGLPESQLERNVGDVSALPGSRIMISARLNALPGQAELLFDSGRRIGLKQRGVFLSGQFYLTQNDRYHFTLRDTAGIENQNPISYRVSALEDQNPFVRIPEPGQDVEQPLDGVLRLKIEAEDDFGVARLRFLYRIRNRAARQTDTTWSAEQLSIKPASSASVIKEWDFNTLPLAFGDTLLYYAEAKDNRTVGKPGKGKSSLYMVWFPSLQDLFEQSEQQQDEQISKLEDIKEESRSVQKELEKINRELKRDPKMNWDKKQKIEKALERQKQLQKKLNEVRKNLEQAVKKLEKNNLISPEVLQKYNQLQELFKEVVTPEMMQALQKLQDSLQKNNALGTQKALQKFKLDQAAFEKNIERTMELLKQVQFEQKMDRLVKEAEKLEQQQNKISDQIKQEQENKQPQTEALQNLQKQQKQQLENLQRDLEAFRKQEQSEKYPKMQQTVDSVRSELQSDALKKDMQAMQEQLAAQKMPQAMQQSQRLQQQFSQMRKQMQQAQAQMLQQGKQQLAQKMQEIAGEMLQLSFKQEDVLRRTRQTPAQGNNFNRIEKQQGLIKEHFKKVISKVVEVSKETFFIKPQISSALRQAQQSMQRSLDQLSERSKFSALQAQQKAMSALNNSAMQMQQSMSQMMQSKSGTGFEQFMEAMQKMAGQQGQLNQQTLSMLQSQGNSGQLTPSQQAQMKRMAAGQAALRKAMEELNEKMGSRSDMLGDLKQIGQDMAEVEKDLLKNQLNRKTIERQRRILSRMLDAQHSMEERKYSKKRKSEQGKRYGVKDPGTLKSGLRADKEKIEQARQKALKEDFTPEYKQMIERYFERLLKAEDAGE